MGPKWAQRVPDGAQVDAERSPNGAKWSLNGKQNRYEDPPKVNCSIQLIAHGLHMHFDMVLERKNDPKLVWTPEKFVLSIVTTKHLDVF